MSSIVERIGIPEWYAGKNIFITGSTGFMGKVLVEKLLRDCPDINCLYLLIRPKKGVEADQRKDEYLKSIVFDQIKKTRPEQLKKVRVIKGDVTQDQLGIDEIDRLELLSNVDIVMHGAANVRFDQPLKSAVNMNTVGTYRLLQLAEKMKKLVVFVHISTAYCHCNEDILEERAYPPPHDPMGIIQMVDSLEEDIIDQITPKLLKGLPNTYAYTKALTEGLINKYEGKLPIVVCRPSIVTAARREPLPGWVEGTNGPSGLMIGAARGVIRSMHCNPDYPADVIPVDVAINGILVAGWERGQMTGKSVEYYNVVLSHKVLPTWGENIETGKRIFYKNPLCFSLWYPDGSIKSNYYKHLFSVIFFHYLPAYFIDFMLMIFRQKPFLVRVQRRISSGLKILQYYTTKLWIFKNEKLEKVHSSLSLRDKEMFDVTIDQINWEQYVHDYIIGIRLYILNEPLETLPKARKLLTKLYILDRIVTFAFYGLIFWFLWIYLEIFFNYFAPFFEATKTVCVTKPMAALSI